MSHKTKVRAFDPNGMPPSSATLIREGSKAKVLEASTKRFLAQSGGEFGMPSFSRRITDSDVVEGLVKQYG